MWMYKNIETTNIKAVDLKGLQISTICQRGHLIIPKSHWSEIPLVRNPISPKSHWSKILLIRNPINLRKLYAKLYFKWKRIVFFTQRVIWDPIGPKSHWSEIPLVRKLYITSTRKMSIFAQIEESHDRHVGVLFGRKEVLNVYFSFLTSVYNYVECHKSSL